jgi:hypothetical protein
MNLAAKLFHPSTLVLLGANALPLLGVAYWHWDVFLLLILYWMETLIIGFWSIAAIAVAPGEAMGKEGGKTSRFFLVPFFTLHAGIFMSVHFVFLWDLFAGQWTQQVHGAGDFIIVIVLATGLWLPLIALFISRGFSFLLRFLGARFVPDSLAFLRPDHPSRGAGNAGSVLAGFYGRIVSMHLAVLFGAFFAAHLGTMAPLILLIGLKVAADLGFHFIVDLREDENKPVIATTV